MTIKVALHHRTHYAFDRLVGLSPHEVRLRPAAHSRTPIESYSLKVKPGEALPQLAAGPVRELARAPGLPGEGARARGDGRPGRRHDGHQPVRLLRRRLGGALPVRVHARERARAGALPRGRAAHAAAHRRGSRMRARASPQGSPTTIDFLVAVNAQAAARRALPHPHGAGHPGARAHARERRRARAATRRGCWCRSCGASASPRASPRDISSSSSPTRSRSTARRARRRTSPTCTRGARPTSPAPAGSASTPPRACSPARATSRSRAPRCPRRAAPVTGFTDVVQDRRSTSR